MVDWRFLFFLAASCFFGGAVSERRVVLVTGGNRGIGRSISRKFAERGDQVVVNYHSNRAAAEELLESLDGTGHSLAQCDVSDPEACAQMMEQVSERYGRLDVLVNNAAVYEEAPPLSVSYSDWIHHWELHLATNVLGPACLSWCAARLMAAKDGASAPSSLQLDSPAAPAVASSSSDEADGGDSDGGTDSSPPPPSSSPEPETGSVAMGLRTRKSSGVIIGVSSRGASRGEPNAVAYGASKAALNSMCQSLALSLGGRNIAVAAVAPGFVSTEMAAKVLEGPLGSSIREQSPYGRVGTPEEIARVVVFLAEPESTWVSGSVVDCNGASYLH